MCVCVCFLVTFIPGNVAKGSSYRNLLRNTSASIHLRFIHLHLCVLQVHLHLARVICYIDLLLLYGGGGTFATHIVAVGYVLQ